MQLFTSNVVWESLWAWWTYFQLKYSIVLGEIDYTNNSIEPVRAMSYYREINSWWFWFTANILLLKQFQRSLPTMWVKRLLSIFKYCIFWHRFILIVVLKFSIYLYMDFSNCVNYMSSFLGKQISHMDVCKHFKFGQ